MEFPGSPVVRTPHFHGRGGLSLIPGWGTRVPQAVKLSIHIYIYKQYMFIREKKIRK